MNDIINEFIEEICYISTDYDYIPTRSDIMKFCKEHDYPHQVLLEWLKLLEIEQETGDSK